MSTYGCMRLRPVGTNTISYYLLLLELFVFYGVSVAQHVNTTSVGQFANPVLWEDLADLDVFRVGSAYYYSASNMHYSPGAPILRSFDLVHWEYVGHSIPRLDFGKEYDLDGGSAYVRGTWASFLNYRKSNRTFYWGGCVDFNKTYIYTAKAAAGPWSRHAVLDHCYYDAGLLIDDDDKMYIAYGNTNMQVAELNSDATVEFTSKKVFTASPDVGTLEGSRFYKINGNYYIFADRPPNGEFVLRSTTGPFGPYTMQKLVLDAISPVVGSGSPHQGGIVQTVNGQWYYMGFIDAYPGGRIPVLAPLKWNADGWPELQLEPNNHWGVSYPYPATPHSFNASLNDNFSAKELGPEWEWNHNPDASHYALDHGLHLHTATVTKDLYMAKNTLTHRIRGPKSTATILLDYSRMKDGDMAGLAVFKNASSWVGVERSDGKYKVAMKTGLDMDQHWKTTSTGHEVECASISGGKIWLRATADIRPGVDRAAEYAYSTNGKTFVPIGTAYVLNSEWMYFMGYRFAIFNYATEKLGGEVKALSFTESTTTQ